MNAEQEVREMAQIMAERRGQLRKQGGRPNKFNYRRVMRILRYLRDGYPPSIASEAGGIAQRTWSEWCEKFPKLAALAARAENQGFAEMTREVRHGVDIKGNPDWKARMAILERRKRDVFGPPKAEGLTVNVNNNSLTMIAAPQSQDMVQSLHDSAMKAILEQRRFPQISREPYAQTIDAPAVIEEPKACDPGQNPH